MLLTNFKERPSKLEKGYSQVLVKQTVGLFFLLLSHICIHVLSPTLHSGRAVREHICFVLDKNRRTNGIYTQ